MMTAKLIKAEINGNLVAFEDITCTQILTDKKAELVKLIVLETGVGGGASGFTWNVVLSNTNLAPNNGYVAKNDQARLTLTLPTGLIEQGQKLIFMNKGIAGLRIQQATVSQQIRIGNRLTTLGIQGALESRDLGDFIELVYLDGIWTCSDLIGNIEVL